MIILFLWPDEKVRTNLFFWSCHVGRYEVKVGLIQLASECHAWSSKVVKIPLNESVLRYYNVLLSFANAFLGRKNKQLTLPECDMTTCFSEMPTIVYSRTYFWNLSAARRVIVVTFWLPFLSDPFFLHQISFLSLTRPWDLFICKYLVSLLTARNSWLNKIIIEMVVFNIFQRATLLFTQLHLNKDWTFIFVAKKVAPFFYEWHLLTSHFLPSSLSPTLACSMDE